MTSANPDLPATVALHRSELNGSPAFMARLWRTLSHGALLAILALLAVLIFLADIFLPQLPSLLAADPLASSTWLSAISAQYPAGPLLEALGLFDLAHSNLVRLLLALLVLVLLIRILNRLYLAWHSRKLDTAWQVLPDTTAYDLELEQNGDPVPLQEACEQSCGRHQYLPAGPEDEAEQWLGDRNQRLTWLAALIEVGMLLAVLALLLNLRSGWQLDDLSLDPGGTLELAPFRNGTISLDGEGQTLRLCCPDRVIAVRESGILPRSLTVDQKNIGSALRVSVLSANSSLPIYAIEQAGNPSPELVVRFPQERSERAIAIPERNVVLRIVDIEDDAFQIQALDASSNILLSDIVTGAGELLLDDLTLRFEPTVFITFDISSRPWLWLLIPATVLFLIGIFFRWRYPYFRLGILHDAGGTAIRWQGQTGAHPTLSEFNEQLLLDASNGQIV